MQIQKCTTYNTTPNFGHGTNSGLVGARTADKYVIEQLQTKIPNATRIWHEDLAKAKAQKLAMQTAGRRQSKALAEGLAKLKAHLVEEHARIQRMRANLNAEQSLKAQRTLN